MKGLCRKTGFLCTLLILSLAADGSAAQYATADLDGLWTITWNGSATDISSVIFDSGGNIVWSDDADIVSGRITVRANSGQTDGRIVLASGVLSTSSQMSAAGAMSAGTYSLNPGRSTGTWTATRIASVLLAGDGFVGPAIDAGLWSQFDTNDAGNMPLASGGRLRIVKNGDGKRTGLVSQFSLSSLENFRAQVDVFASACRSAPCGIGIGLQNVKSGDLFDEHIYLSFERRAVVPNVTATSFVAQRFIGDVQVERTGAATLKDQGVLVLRYENGEFALEYTEKNGIPTTLATFNVDEDWTLETENREFRIMLYGWAEQQALNSAGFSLGTFRLYLLP